MARVFVTGATGFVGGRLALALAARGDEVVALVRTPSDELARAGIDQVTGDLGALDAMGADQLAPDDLDAVAHVAASTDADLAAARAVNQAGTATLAGLAARRAGARLVYVSTTSVYDLTATGDGVVDELAPLVRAGADAPAISSSASSYAVTKAEGEAEVARAAAAGSPATVLRPPAVLGAGPTSTWGTTIPSRLRDGQWRPPHPATTMGWVHVDDLVAAIVAAIDRPVDATLNVVGGHTTFGAYVDELIRLVPGTPADAAATADESRTWHGSYATDRLPELLGVTPQRSFDDAMEELARWWTPPGGR